MKNSIVICLFALIALFFCSSKLGAQANYLSGEKTKAEIVFERTWPGIYLDLLFKNWRSDYIAFSVFGEHDRYFVVVDTVNKQFTIPGYMPEKHQNLAVPGNIDSLTFEWSTAKFLFEEGSVNFSVTCNLEKEKFIFKYKFFKSEIYGETQVTSELKKL